MKHTLFAERIGAYWHVSYEPGWYVAQIFAEGAEAERYARLFAAAPEMLKALERIAELRDLWEAEHALTGPEAELLALADAAIMAATTEPAKGGE